MSNNVLKTVTKADIQQARADAEFLYMIRQDEGVSVDSSGELDEFGNFPSKFFRSPMIKFEVNGLEQLIDFVSAKQLEGWKRSTVPIDNMVSNLYVVYLLKPDEAIQADLKEEFKEAEEALRARVEKANEAVIAATVAQRKAQVLKEREEAARAADEALEAELEVEVRAALKGAK